MRFEFSNVRRPLRRNRRDSDQRQIRITSAMFLVGVAAFGLVVHASTSMIGTSDHGAQPGSAARSGEWGRTIVAHAEDSFAPHIPLPAFDRGEFITAPNVDFVRIADLDGDGDLDFLAADKAGPDRIDWYENETVRADVFTKHEISSNSGGVRVVAPGDVDADGDIDFFALEPDRTRVRLYLNDGAGEFDLVTRFTETAAGVTYIEAADVDGDGRADLFTVDNDDDLVELWWNPGLPESRDRMKRDRIANVRSLGVEKVRIADIDNDGDMDLLALRRVPYIVFQWLRQPDGSFERDPGQIQKSPGGDNAFNWNSIDVGDVDGDGDMDFVTSELDGQLCWYANPLITRTEPGPATPTPADTPTTTPADTPTTAPTEPSTATAPPTNTLAPGETPATPTPSETPDSGEPTPIPADIVYLPRAEQS